MNLKILTKKPGRVELPMVPMRELAVFPHMVVPFFVGRPGSIKAVEAAMAADRTVCLVCQKGGNEDPEDGDMHRAGTVAKILQILKLPDGTIRVLAEGQQRTDIQRFTRRKETMYAFCRTIEDSRETTSASAALMQTVHAAFQRYGKLNKKISAEVISSVEKAEYPDKLVDLIAGNLPLSVDKKIELLALEGSENRLESLAVILESENEILGLQNKIRAKVKKRLERNQKEYFLNEQIKEIRKELGKDGDESEETADLEQKIQAKNPPQEVIDKAKRELSRLSKLQPISPESGVIRTYLEWIADLPWSNRTQDNRDIDLAAKILDEDHYDMKKPKERILDFIAVHQLKEKVRGPILCFVGPPGTGKTSLGKSVARALGREFIRISLGGVRDEAEIRGHRKTYVGALPGKILQAMKKVGTINPVFLLDEVDKISSDFRGDPASALLEVLDPEQNSTFIDHYMELPYDLSSVMFITTANSMYSIPHPLRDRMEIIEIPGYTDYEKVKIATEFIIPKQIEANGLDWADITFQKPAIELIIRGYTMESGVRNLEREIAGIIRKIAREAVRKGFARTPEESDNGKDKTAPRTFKYAITEKTVGKLLGSRKYLEDLVYLEARPGLVHGLAWTEAGGTLLPVEVSVLEGQGELILTGSLGDVMKESARTALSFIRAHRRKFGLDGEFQRYNDIHVHVPEGAIPKDGPSAGITLTAAIISALTSTPVKDRYAMTGEITLTGRLLPIGGVKEKILAAHRNHMTHVLLPEDNRKDIQELPKEIRSSMNFLFADSVLDAVLLIFPESLGSR